jgi:hypothetical protein
MASLSNRRLSFRAAACIYRLVYTLQLLTLMQIYAGPRQILAQDAAPF